MINYDKMQKLGDLYEKTGYDWDLHIYHCLTEPTCPTAYVYPEGNPSNRYRVDADTIEDAVNGAIDLAYRELVLGETVTPMCPFALDSDRPDLLRRPK